MGMVFLILMILGGFWFWQSSLVVRELAQQACSQACRRQGVQLLDDAIALEMLWPQRDGNGNWSLERRYAFEFTDTGAVRQRGVVVMLGRQLEWVAMDGGDLFIP